jgi:hypothetical protein
MCPSLNYNYYVLVGVIKSVQKTLKLADLDKHYVTNQ